MKTKTRVKAVFSLNAETGQPQTNYMVQKRVWGIWKNVRQYINERDALVEADLLRGIR